MDKKKRQRLEDLVANREGNPNAHVTLDIATLAELLRGIDDPAQADGKPKRTATKPDAK